MPLELWSPSVPVPQLAGTLAEQAEAAGWDGIVFVDSQNLAPDTYVGLALAAQSTSRLKLGTGVTNPYTRHPAVTASAIATIQQLSGGRAVLGIGRGDSSLAYIGLAPAPVSVFARYLERLQAYLAGEEVQQEPEPGLSSIDELPLARAPGGRIEWISRGGERKVPVDVVATGPRVIALGARLADRLTFAVGADPDRMRSVVELARQSRADAGLDPGSLSMGAYVNVVAHPDLDVARELAAPGLFSFARFSAMHGVAAGTLVGDDRRLVEQIPKAYDMTRHFRRQDAQATVLTPEFAERFGVVGPPGRCVDRLVELLALGLERLVVVGASLDGDRQAREAAGACFLDEVMPGLRAAAESS